AAFFTSFILLMTLLREAAETSRAVRDVGAQLTHQPAGRRYIATGLGGHFLGVLLNFGAVSLLASLIQQGLRADPKETKADRRRYAIRQQRQISALVRGFSWMIVWAPTTITQAVLLAALPDIRIERLILLGFALTALVFLVGWIEDRVRWHRIMRTARPVVPQTAPLSSWRDLGIVCAVLIGGTLAVQTLFSVPTTRALMVAAPLLLVGWVVAQRGARDGQRRLAEIARYAVPKNARDSIGLGAAGFIGVAAAALAPSDAIVEWFHPEQLPPVLFLLALPVTVILAGQIALSPIMTVAFLGAVVTDLPLQPASPELVGVALAVGWALTMTASPNATGTIAVSNMTGLPPVTLTWQWNLVFTAFALMTAGLFFWVCLALGY
ncbi:MAG: hypothetical protein AAFV62_12125, partial [Pseudomonadota bacterium]